MSNSGTTPSTVSGLEPETIAETLQTYQKQILVGVIVLAAAGGGFWMWKRSAEIREDRAGEAYQVAEGAFASGNMPLAQTELEKITGRYAGTSPGTQAAMLLAQVHFGQGKYEDGMKVLEAASSKAPAPLKAGIQALMGAGYEGTSKPAEAAAAYGKAAELSQFDIDRDMFRMEQARILATAGDAAGAGKIYLEIGQREDSPFAGEAKVRLGEQQAKP
jgi:predicted negative regulator of RcsB-dependent stress response